MTYIVIISLRDGSQKLFVLEDYKITERLDYREPDNQEHERRSKEFEAMLQSLDGAVLTEEQQQFVKTEFLSGGYWQPKDPKGNHFLSGDFRLIQVKYYE